MASKLLLNRPTIKVGNGNGLGQEAVCELTVQSDCGCWEPCDRSARWRVKLSPTSAIAYCDACTPSCAQDWMLACTRCKDSLMQEFPDTTVLPA